jgi:hypothetical protein
MDGALQQSGIDDDLRARLVVSLFQTADWMRNRPEDAPAP